MAERVVRFSELCNFSDCQQRASDASDLYQYVLFGGSRGPGKSYWLRWESCRRLLKLAKAGVQRPVGGLFCEDYPSLKDRHIGKLTTELPPYLGSLRDSKEHGLAYHLYPEYGGGVLKLRNLDDASKYQSSEFAHIAVDELTKNPLETFNVLRGSLRWPGVDRPTFISGTNPGSIGHLWVRAYWIDRQYPPEMAKITEQFSFVRALPADNPHLSQNYWDMLDSLPPDLARAWRDGDWDVFEGQFFGNLSRKVHGFTGDWPSGKHICSMDYGEAAPSAVYWAVVDTQGDVWVYRELYGAGYQYVGLKTAMRELNGDTQIAYTVASPDIFMTSKGTGVVGSEVFNSNRADYGGFSWPVVRADNNRIEGWRHFKHWLTAEKVHIHLENCPNFWRTVPAMIYDERNVEDMDGKGEDHCSESTRYLLMSRPKPVPVAGAGVAKYSAEWIDKQFRNV